MLVYNWVPIFHLIKVFAVLIRLIYFCCCLMVMLFNFVCFDSLRPINNLSVIKGRVFLG